MIKPLAPALQVLFFIFLVIFMSLVGDRIWGLAISVSVRNEAILEIDWADPRIYLSRVFFSQVFGFLLAFMLFLRLSGERFSDFTLLKKIKPQLIGFTLFIALASLFLFPLLEWLNEPLRQLLPAAMLAEEEATNALQIGLVLSDDAVQYLFLMITMAVAPSIFEELVYRGFLIHKMMQSGISENGAIWMSAAIFAISHFQPLKFLAMFTLGAALGFTYRKFGNIKYSMLFHFFINGSQITVGFLTASGWLGEGVV